MQLGVGDTGQTINLSNSPWVSGNLPLCSGMTLPPGFVGPVNCDPSQGNPTYTPSVSQVYNLAGQVQDLQDQVSSIEPGVSTSTLLLVAAGLVGLMMLSRR